VFDPNQISLRSTAGKRSQTPEHLARECLGKAHNDFERAIALAFRRVRGGKQFRATVAAIGSAFLRASNAVEGGAS
jgi:hypothetical protein